MDNKDIAKETERLLDEQSEKLNDTVQKLTDELEDLQRTAESFESEVNELNRESVTQLKFESMELADKARADFDKKYGTGRKKEEEKIELTLEPNKNYEKVRLEMDKDLKRLDQTRMGIESDISDKKAAVMEKASEAADTVKKAVTEGSEKVREKAQEGAEKFKESGLGKAILGDDGKFDGKDMARIGENIADAASDLADSIKGFFRKK